MEGEKETEESAEQSRVPALGRLQMNNRLRRRKVGDPGRRLLATSPHCHGDVASVALAIGETPRMGLKMAPPQV